MPVVWPWSYSRDLFAVAFGYGRAERIAAQLAANHPLGVMRPHSEGT